MATYQELYDLANDASLLNKVTTAVVMACEAIRTEAAGTTNHANRLLWAKAAMLNPTIYALPMLRAALAQNAALTKANIQSATDAALQTAITNVIDIFATGS